LITIPDTFDFRPHSGCGGARNHLTAAFLLADNITHGVNLHKSPVLGYLYYLEQIGISISPLGEDSLYIEYEKNPFVHMFYQGHNLSLSSDNPLQLHTTEEPLMEEYSVAAKVFISLFIVLTR
jgi:AMP deaminase